MINKDEIIVLLFYRDILRLKSGMSKKQGDIALLFAHNQGTILSHMFLGIMYVHVNLHFIDQWCVRH